MAAGATILPNGAAVGDGRPDAPVGVISHTDTRPPGVVVANCATVGVGPPCGCGPLMSLRLHARPKDKTENRASGHNAELHRLFDHLISPNKAPFLSRTPASIHALRRLSLLYLGVR